jgi:hypothetical protein
MRTRLFSDPAPDCALNSAKNDARHLSFALAACVMHRFALDYAPIHRGAVLGE